MEERVSLKRFAEWVTDLKNKYQYDPFFRTECNVITLQVIAAVFMLVLIGVAFNYLYKDIVETLLAGIRESLVSGGSINGDDILESVRSVRTSNFIVVLATSAVVTALFGYFISRVALSPARNALTSQKRFISDVAHELRTPLAVIKTNIEVTLLDEKLDPELALELNSNIEELDRASQIINNLLSFSNWSTPERVSFSEVAIAPLLDTAVHKLRDFADSKHIDITVEKKEEKKVWGNATALEQILVNLVKNAINYTPRNGFILVSVAQKDSDHAIITVKDTGVGIAEADLHHIFEPFYRAERSRSRQAGTSSGLGLTIASELVKMHRGKIIIKSAPDRGTTAMVILPYDQKSSMPAITAHSEPVKNEISLDFLRKHF